MVIEDPPSLAPDSGPPVNPAVANEGDLYFERGGPIQRFGERLADRWGWKHTVRVRIIAFLAVTWLPLLLLALLEGRALTADPAGSLLLDFGTYARFFVAAPLLIVAELIVGPRLKSAGRQLVQGGFIQPEDYPAFEQAIARAARRRESIWAELVIVTIALAGSWMFSTEAVAGGTIATWRLASSPESQLGVSLTALWYRIVAVPMLQYFWYRWLWRLLIWCAFLWTVSRLKLSLVASHADQAGGLGFLGTAHTSLGIFAVALGSILSAETAFLLVFRDAQIQTFQMPFIVFLVIMELFILGPLLMFVPVLTQTRLAGLREFSLLVTRYNREFREKWVLGKHPADERLLGSADIQSLADLANSFEYIRGMKVVPFSLRVTIQLAIVASLPCLPLVLLVMPIGTLFDLLTKAVF